ncbi:caspase family protein [Bradyrhizobium brasilense]|uniref:caspase family protein n=1 Tax=Bradyrhizobium brasilense TaxID=1419277 RepID=UPI002877FD70|nr:caspase family protein [Bradyrhizobium brasilense]MCP3414231.1 caspase family protein [Bradyrhizobium brasilense]
MSENVDRALVFEDQSPGPGTHAIIIGIGHYDALQGGANEDSELSADMDQLAAPPRSAEALAGWFLESFYNPDRPLKSLSLILSSGTDPAIFSHERANHAEALPNGTIEVTTKAILAWARRASSDPENLAIFHFCGHGVSTGEPILLLRDYGVDPDSRFDRTINFNDFVMAMQTRRPRHQLFLIDACRVPDPIARNVPKHHVGRSCIDPLPSTSRGELARQSVHHSTSDLAPAYGRTSGASLYTEALLQALDGGGIQQNFDAFVSTLGLQTALDAYIARATAREKVEQQPQLTRSHQFTIHKPSNVRIPLYVVSDPAAALKNARVEAMLGGIIGDYYDSVEHGQKEEWTTTLPMREHTIVAKFQDHLGYKEEEVIKMLVPPEVSCKIKCRRR